VDPEDWGLIAGFVAFLGFLWWMLRKAIEKV
jgi:cbb3-type cytochrome oxidase subunit 3